MPNNPNSDHVRLPQMVANYQFLSNWQISRHWSINLWLEMTTEKLQHHASSAIPSEEKEAILRIWNLLKAICLAKQFPMSLITDAVFGTYLLNYVFLVLT